MIGRSNEIDLGLKSLNIKTRVRSACCFDHRRSYPYTDEQIEAGLTDSSSVVRNAFAENQHIVLTEAQCLRGIRDSCETVAMSFAAREDYTIRDEHVKHLLGRNYSRALRNAASRSNIQLSDDLLTELMKHDYEVLFKVADNQVLPLNHQQMEFLSGCNLELAPIFFLKRPQQMLTRAELDIFKRSKHADGPMKALIELHEVRIIAKEVSLKMSGTRIPTATMRRL